MAKYKILFPFRDNAILKEKGEVVVYKVNDVVEFSDKRAKEILKVGKWIKKIKEEKEVKAKTSEK